MSPRRRDVITLANEVWGLALTRIAVRNPLVPAKAGSQDSIPERAGMSGFARGLVLGTLFSCALALSACGRAGPLEPPPGPAAVPAARAQLTQPDGSPAPGSTQDTAAKSGFDAQGNPVATPSQKRSFILDPLLR
jgi:predicted small lipoprotein YifL